MKIQVVVCIHDRLENLLRWIHAWRQCDQTNATLTIVHNSDVARKNPFEAYCKAYGIEYIKRRNVGFETGVIQDVFLRKIISKRWDAMLFCTDDTIPMKRDFVSQFRGALTKDVGVACMDISGVWTPHIRTTGFCVTKEVAKAVQWTHKPIKTKDECYFFEHQGFENTFMSQVLKMDKRVIQLSSIKESVLWDTDHNAHHNRMDEWHSEFPGYNHT